MLKKTVKKEELIRRIIEYKKFKEISENYNIELIIDSNIEQLSKTIGKSNKAILGIKDRNFAKSIQKKYNGGDIIG